MLDEQSRKKMEAMLAQQQKELQDMVNDKEFKALTKGMGDDEDSDMKELYKMMANQDKLMNADDIENMNDDELMAELVYNIYQLDDHNNVSIEELKKQETELTTAILQQKKLALAAKNQNDIEKAKLHLGRSKELQKELDQLYEDHPKLKQSQQQQQQQPQQQPQVQQKPQVQVQQQKQEAASTDLKLNFDLNDDIEVEDNIHDSEKIVAMSVIEYEIEVMHDFIKSTSGDEKGFFQDKLEQLEFAKGTCKHIYLTLENNIQIGILTVDKYLKDIKSFLAKEQMLLKQLSTKLQPSNKHIKRIKRRIELVENEIKESEEPAQDELEEQEAEQFTQSKDYLIINYLLLLVLQNNSK